MGRKTLTIIISTAIFCMAYIKADAQTEISDSDIASEIELRFYNDVFLSAQLVDVTTQEGIVTLEGTVHNLLAKQRLIDVAKSIQGVRGVVDKLTIKTPYVPDADLKQNIIDALQEDPATDIYKIDVLVEDGSVRLIGSVNSWQEKQLAGEVVKEVAGVRAVANELIFVWNEHRSDEEIRKDIKGRLQSDFLVDDGMIDVSVEDGHVDLSGAVGSSFEKGRAEIDAWVANVESVDVSDLVVKPWLDDVDLIKSKYEPKTDLEIKNAIAAALKYDSRVHMFNIDIKVDSGIVTLSGTVDNLIARRAAKRSARHVVGVLDVKNTIKVRPETILEDQPLAAKVEEKISKDPYLSLYDINVYATNTKIMLSGDVSSAFEKMQAEILAAKTKGVTSVQNMLSVSGLTYHIFEWDMPGAYTSYVHPQFDIADDLDLKRQIESQIWWSPFVDRNDVDITVENGVVTLTGMVDSRRERQYAELNALEGGAVRVDNNLIVDMD